jgi:hypothetical protein
MFDLKTFKVLGRIPAAEDADAIFYDPASVDTGISLRGRRLAHLTSLTSPSGCSRNGRS